MIGRFNPAGLLAGRPDVQRQAMMAQQQPETRQGLLGRTRGVIGGLLGSARDSMEANNPDATWADRLMILSGGLQQLGGTQGALMDATGFVDQRVQGRQQQQAMQQQQEQMAQFRASLPPEQQRLFDMNPEGFLQQMTQAEFREAPAGYQMIGPDHPMYPPGGRGMYQVNTRTGQVTNVGNTAEPSPMANVNVNIPGQPMIGTIPPGYQAIQDPQTGAFRFEPIVGGPVEQERLERERRDEGRAAERQRAGSTVLREANRGLEILPEINQREGVVGSNLRLAASRVPGTPEHLFMQQIDSAKSNLGLDRLQQMRENSPTGGALGQVPFQQQQRLEQVLGSFDITQPPNVLEENLRYLNNAYLDFVYGTDGERQRLVREGQLDAQQNAEINRSYYDLSWDNFGRRTGQGAERQRGGRRGDQGAAPPMRAVNPQTGEALVLRNGQWVPE